MVGLLLALPACPTYDVFTCSSDADCQGDGVGQCEANGFCSFPDQQCPSGRRYGELAGGGFANDCVDIEDGSTGLATSDATMTATTASDSAPVTTTETTLSTTSTAGSESTSDPTAAGSSTGDPQPTCETVVDEQFSGGMLDALWEIEVGEPMITIEDGYAEWMIGPLSPVAYRGIHWPQPLPLAGLQVTMEIRQPPTFDDYQLRLDLLDESGRLIGWLWDEGEIQAETADDNGERMQIGTVPFDAEEDRFLRVREANARILFESSSDGRTFDEHFVLDADMLGAEVDIAVAVQALPGVGDVIQVDSIQICALP